MQEENILASILSLVPRIRSARQDRQLRSRDLHSRRSQEPRRYFHLIIRISSFHIGTDSFEYRGHPNLANNTKIPRVLCESQNFHCTRHNRQGIIRKKREAIAVEVTILFTRPRPRSSSSRSILVPRECVCVRIVSADLAAGVCSPQSGYNGMSA